MKPYYLIVPESAIEKEKVKFEKHDAALKTAMQHALKSNESILVVSTVDRVLPDFITYIQEIQDVIPGDIIPEFDAPDPIQEMFPGVNLDEYVDRDHTRTRRDVFIEMFRFGWSYNPTTQTWSMTSEK